MDKWELWFDLKKEHEICMVSKAFILAVGPMPPFSNSVALSPGVHQPEHETYCIPPSSTEVKNEWSYYSTPSYAFMACKGITFLLMVTEL
jgi:hypothetical protein